MGRDTNAVSGKAIRARQEQGGVVTTAFFDNHRLAFKISGEIILSLMEQLYTEEKKVRITGGENGQNAEFLSINEIDPTTGQIIGDITSTQADFVISEQDYSATIRQAMFDSLTDMIKTMDPNAAMSILDLVFEMSDLPGKEKFVDRLRKITGQRGAETVPTEEDIAAEQQKAAEAQAQMEAQNLLLQTQLAAEQAKVKKLEQETQLIAAKIKTESVNQQVKASGVDYDQEKLRIEKANALNAIEQAEHARTVEQSQPGNSPEAAAQEIELREREANVRETQAAHDMQLKADKAAHEKEVKEKDLAHNHAHIDKMGEHQRVLETKDQQFQHDQAKKVNKSLVKHADTAGRSIERGLKSNNTD
jgi:hypothetical protein